LTLLPSAFSLSLSSSLSAALVKQLRRHGVPIRGPGQGDVPGDASTTAAAADEAGDARAVRRRLVAHMAAHPDVFAHALDSEETLPKYLVRAPPDWFQLSTA
jgi:hypothetical protein